MFFLFRYVLIKSENLTEKTTGLAYFFLHFEKEYLNKYLFHKEEDMYHNKNLCGKFAIFHNSNRIIIKASTKFDMPIVLAVQLWFCWDCGVCCEFQNSIILKQVMG